MTLALLLVLAGLLPTKESRTLATPTQRPSKAAAARPAAILGPKGTDSMTQLYNPRTGVTCTLRVVRIDPQVDAEMVAKAKGSDDSMARNELSPCVE